MARSLLALGSNLGDRHAIMARACAEIAELPGCQLLARSRWHGTVPIGGAAGQGDFLNGAVLVETTLPPRELALALKAIETRLGRQRAVRWDARLIDIDLLLYDSVILDTEDLIVPHPRMSVRLFVLEPALEIAGAMLHPTSGWTLWALLTHLRSSPRSVAVVATEIAIADWLADHLHQALGCPILPRTAGKSITTGVLPPGSGVQSTTGSEVLPPVVATWSFEDLTALATSGPGRSVAFQPALAIALDYGEAKCYRGLGPLARIASDNPATILQEAVAAVRCVWPNIASSSD